MAAGYALAMTGKRTATPSARSDRNRIFRYADLKIVILMSIPMIAIPEELGSNFLSLSAVLNGLHIY
jgi:hypothetical protein